MYKGSCHEFRYGPTFAFLFTPLTLLPVRLGVLVLMWLNLATFAWTMRWLARDILPGRWNANQEGTFLLLALLTTYRGFWSVQTNMLIVTCLVAALMAAAQRRWALAALFLALPVHIKIWPLAAALLVVACWPCALIVRFGAALLAVAALPMLLKGPSLVWVRYADWFQALVGPMQIRHDYHDMWTVLEAFQRPDHTAYTILQLSTGVLVLGVVPVAEEEQGPDDWAAIDVRAGHLGRVANAAGAGHRAGDVRADLAAHGLGVDNGLCHRTWPHRNASGVQPDRAGRARTSRNVCHGPNINAGHALHPLGVMVFAAWLCIYARDWQSEVLQGRRAAVSYWPGRLSQPMLWGAWQGLTDDNSRGR